MARRSAWCVAAWVGPWMVVSGALAASSHTEQIAPGSDVLRGDAQIADVYFVDRQQGWAVGDRGAIWHTGDGGRHWALQPSGVECRLSSVFFIDSQIGWAAGGYVEPYTRVTSGVVLRTRDGGQHWQLDRKLILPAVSRIGFFDARRGWAIGHASAYFPSGVYITEDAGRSWSALAADTGRAWLAGDFVDFDNGALAGRLGALGAVRHREVQRLDADYGLRALRRMRLSAPARGWLVGDGGLVLATSDLGKSWQTPEGDIPATLRDQFDFAALAVQGEHCWIAGSPGSRVLHSADGGRSWTAQNTAHTLPIHGLAFVDARTGWAVGDLGTILATTDGGQSWHKQRAGGSRAAYLGFYGRPTDIPWELLARLSADDGYLGAIEVLNRQDVESPSTDAADPVARLHEAGVLAGASAAETAWRFPLRQASLRLSAEQVVELWDRANDAKSLEKLDAHLVGQLRAWRPSVVFTAAADVRLDDPLAHLVNQVVLRAVEHAADPAQWPEQISQAGLAPWKVQKVYGTLPPGESGTANINTAQLANRLGQSIGELAAGARAIVGSSAAPAVNLGFRLLIDDIPQGVGKRDFFSGVNMAPGGEARRRVDDLGQRDLERMRREVQLRRNLQAILAKAETAEGAESRFLASIGDQTRDLQPARAADVLNQLADRYRRSGRWDLAAECHELLVERHADQPIAAASLVWLVQYYASGEAAWRDASGQQINVRQVSALVSAVDGAEGAAGGAGRIAAPARLDAGAALAGRVSSSASRLEKASGYAKQLEALRPALYGEPVVRFPLSAAQRAAGLPRQGEKFWLAVRHNRPHDAWWACAQGELWLSDGKGDSPKEFWACRRAAGKPRLDGKLDEPFWQAGNRVALESHERDDADWPAVAMLAHDDEFLYLAVSCTKAQGFRYARSDEVRPRDPDLSAQDRVQLLIDVDRDFATYYELTIDHRGWTGERFWGDKTWNPTWFVASGEGDGAWTAEVAIPLSELAGREPGAKRTWAVGVQRIVPGVGFQSWTKPATADVVPEGFGYLVFE